MKQFTTASPIVRGFAEIRNLHFLNLQIVVLLLAVVLTGCTDGEAEFITEPTTIHIQVLNDKITAGTAQVYVEPEDDRAYFYARAIPADMYKPGTMDHDYMTLVMDRVYIDYLEWRYWHLIEGETYIASFSSHSLKYGVQTLHVDTLLPYTRYMIYAFCVNPVNMQPMGKFYYDYFTTDSLIHSDLDFQFKLEERALYIMPSNDNDQYLFSIVEKSEIEQKYNNNLMWYVHRWILSFEEYEYLSYFLHRNAYRQDLEYLLEPATSYLAICTPFDGGPADYCVSCEIYCDPDGVAHLVGQQ